MNVEVRDVVQITDESHHWFGALIIVSEIKSFGVQGFAPIPHNDGSGTGQAYIRLETGKFERVGKAVLAPHGGTYD